MLHRWLDRLLIVLFLFAAFMACIYAPLFYFQCGWEGLRLGAVGSCAETWVGRAWLGYLQVEPYYAQAPLWLQLMNEFDTLLFSWFYVLSVVVFLRGCQDKNWYRIVATFVAGMMTYAMLFYLTWQGLTYRETQADLFRVFMYNGLWLAIFTLLLLRLYWFRPNTGELSASVEKKALRAVG